MSEARKPPAKAALPLDDEPEEAQPVAPPRRSLLFRLRFVIPVVVFAALAIVLAFQLGRQDDEHARDLPSALLDRPLPPFKLPPVSAETIGLSDDDIERLERE